MLPFLLSLQIQSGQSAQVLLTNGFVDSGPSADTLSIVVSCVRPPISFHLDVSENHVLNRCGQAWHLEKGNGLKSGEQVANNLIYINKMKPYSKFHQIGPVIVM